MRNAPPKKLLNITFINQFALPPQSDQVTMLLAASCR